MEKPSFPSDAVNIDSLTEFLNTANEYAESLFSDIHNPDSLYEYVEIGRKINIVSDFLKLTQDELGATTPTASDASGSSAAS